MNRVLPYWWQSSVVYQVYPRSFKDATGNGVGDLRGVTEKLDYLAETLGIDVVWLSPFYPSPMKDFGYDVSDYTDVHPMFGDLDAFDHFVEEAHTHGLKVVIDYVPNHSSDQHEWFQESRASRDNPKRDWYIWRDPKPDGSPPNNWLSVFGGPAWTFDEQTEQYYLHSFLTSQPDLNWRNPEVQEAMFDVLRFWMDRGVDGFRIDVAHSIMKDPDLRDNPMREDGKTGYHKPMGDYDKQIHLHDKGHPDIHQIYRDMRDLFDTYVEREVVSIGEMHIYDWSVWVTYYGENGDELHMPFNFALLNTEWSAQGVREVVHGLEAALPEGAWPNYVLGNHDEARLATRLGPDQTRLAAMLLLTLRGTPTLYYGDEVGMQEADIPPEDQQDPWGRQVPGRGRDGCRTPMQWDGSVTVGFSDADPDDLWLPVGPDHETLNVAHQLDQPDSLLNLYRRLLQLRKSSEALQIGTYVPVSNTPDECFVFIRSRDEEAYLVALNFADASRIVILPGHMRYNGIACSTHMDQRGEAAGHQVELRPYEGLLISCEPI